jgi:hypothetical protein
VHDLGVRQLALEAAGLALPHAAAVFAGAFERDFDAAQAARRFAQRARGRALVVQTPEGGGCFKTVMLMGVDSEGFRKGLGEP